MLLAAGKNQLARSRGSMHVRRGWWPAAGTVRPHQQQHTRAMGHGQGSCKAADTSSQFVGAIVLGTIRYQDVHALVGLLGDLHTDAWRPEPGSRAEAASGHVDSRA